MPPAKFVRDAVGRIGNTIDSIVSAGSVLSGTHLERSVVSLGTVAAGGSTITDSVLLDQVQVGLGARVHRAVLDKNVILEDGATVGVDRDRDLERGFTVTESGITVVGKGIHIAR
jgi:glucose-1-phosphate adenylyltransferase